VKRLRDVVKALRGNRERVELVVMAAVSVGAYLLAQPMACHEEGELSTGR